MAYTIQNRLVATQERIEQLGIEASEAGDTECVTLCADALRGDTFALVRCVEIMTGHPNDTLPAWETLPGDPYNTEHQASSAIEHFRHVNPDFAASEFRVVKKEQ